MPDQNERTRREIEIASTILNQINFGTVSNTAQTISGAHAMLCWGVHRLAAVASGEGRYGGLGFFVNGARYHGHVQVLYVPGDTYTIILEGQELITDIYFDQLAEVLDWHIESGQQ